MSDPFQELLSILSEEELFRLRRRFERLGNDLMVGLLEDELEQRVQAHRSV